MRLHGAAAVHELGREQGLRGWHRHGRLPSVPTWRKSGQRNSQSTSASTSPAPARSRAISIAQRTAGHSATARLRKPISCSQSPRATGSERSSCSLVATIWGSPRSSARAFLAYAERTPPCSQTQASKVSDAAIAEGQRKIEKSIDEIRGVIGDPAVRRCSLPQDGPLRTIYGCPFYDADLDWGHDVASPRTGAMIRAAAASRGAELLRTSRRSRRLPPVARSGAAS